MLALMGLMALGAPHSLGQLLICVPMAAMVQWSAKRLARHWQVQRPFTSGLSPNHLGHSLRPGFPSTHAVVMGFVASFLLLGHPDTAAGLAIASLAAITGWGRVYTGAHFPSDVLAGWTLGGLAALLAHEAVSWWMPVGV